MPCPSTDSNGALASFTVHIFAVADCSFIYRLTTVADAYIKSLAKKKEVETDADGKLKVLPCEALGVTMMGHGEEFGDQSVYGTFSCYDPTLRRLFTSAICGTIDAARYYLYH